MSYHKIQKKKHVIDTYLPSTKIREWLMLGFFYFYLKNNSDITDPNKPSPL